MYRTTALIDAPASVVAAALTETRTLRSVLAGAGLRLLADGEVLAPGETAVVRGRFGRYRARMVEASTTRMSSVVVSGPPLWLTADLASTPAGTLLTSTVDGSSRLGRRRALALVQALADRADARAVELSQARIVVAAAIVRGRALLAQQREFPVETAGRWELPGGRVEPGEAEIDAVRRECAEELGVTVTPGEQLGPDVVLAGGSLLLRTYTAGLNGGEPQPREHRSVRWLTAGTLGDVDWLPADRVLLPQLRSWLAGTAHLPR